MELRYFLWLMRKWFWLILLACLIGAAASLVVSLLQPKMYEGQTTLYVVSPDSSNYNSVIGAQQAAKSFAQLPQSNPVVEATLRTVSDRSLSPSQLSSMITVENDLNSQFVIIRVRDRDPQRAARLATEIARQSIAQFEVTSDSGSTQQFIKQEMDALEYQIKNLQKVLTGVQAQQSALGTPSTSQTALINQLNTTLSDKLSLYNQLLSSYQSLSGFQVTLLGDAQIPKAPVGAGPAVAIAIGMLAGLIVIVAVILFIEQTKGILVPSTKSNHNHSLSTSVIIKGSLEQGSSRPIQSALAASNDFNRYGTVQGAKRNGDWLSEDAATMRITQAAPGDKA